MDGTTTASCMWMNEIKTKTKSSHFTFRFTTRSIIRLAHRQCNGISKEWLHCMTSELKGRFPVDVWLSMMSAHSANTIFLKKMDVQNTRWPPTYVWQHLIFALLLNLHPPQGGRHMFIIPIMLAQLGVINSNSSRKISWWKNVNKKWNKFFVPNLQYCQFEQEK